MPKEISLKQWEEKIGRNEGIFVGKSFLVDSTKLIIWSNLTRRYYHEIIKKLCRY